MNGFRSFDAYDTVVQNLRLIKAPGVNVWSNDAERWSEAALAASGDGLFYLVFCQVGLTMPKFNRLLLSLPLGIERAMHLEGGPEASLSCWIFSGRLQICLCFLEFNLPHFKGLEELEAHLVIDF